MSQSRGLLMLFIVILTSPIWTLIKNSLYAQGWNPQRSSHETFELSKPWFFSTFALPAMLEDQQRLKKVSHPVFTTKKWATWFSLQKSTWTPFRKFPVFLNFYSNWCFEFEFAFEFRTYILHIPWRWSQTNDLSPSVRTLFKKKLPVIFLSLHAREQATIHIFLP